MLIRCERCSTLYELDEALLSPDGSPVQCTRCQHVFTARPPLAPGRTLVGVPAVVAPDPSPAAAAPPAQAAEAAPAGTPAQVPSGGGEEEAVAVRPTAAGRLADGPRPIRTTAGPAVYRPAQSQNPMSRPATIRRESVGAFEARLRWSARRKWLWPLVAAAILVAAGSAYAFLRRDHAPSPGSTAPSAGDPASRAPAEPARGERAASDAPPAAKPPSAPPAPAGEPAPAAGGPAGTASARATSPAAAAQPTAPAPAPAPSDAAPAAPGAAPAAALPAPGPAAAAPRPPAPAGPAPVAGVTENAPPTPRKPVAQPAAPAAASPAPAPAPPAVRLPPSALDTGAHPAGEGGNTP